jgi:hypothetical protein
MHKCRKDILITAILFIVLLLLFCAYSKAQSHNDAYRLKLREPVIKADLDTGKCILTVIEDTPYIHSSSENLIGCINPTDIVSIHFYKVEIIKTNPKYTSIRKYLKRLKQNEFVIVTLKNKAKKNY